MKLYNPSFFLLAALVSFPQLSETIYTPSLPELAKYFETTANLMQHSLSIYFLGFAVGVFFFGRLCDVVGRKRSMLMGLLVYSAASFACIYAEDIWVFLAARFIQAFGASVGSVVTQTMLRDIYTGEKRARVFSKLTAVISFAPAMGPFIGSKLSYLFSPQANFVFLFAFGLFLFLGSSMRLKETFNTRLSVKINMRALFLRMIRDKHIWLCAFFVAAHNGIIFSLHAEAPFIFIDMLSVDPAHYGMIGLLLGGSVFIGSMINSRLLKRLSPYTLNMGGSFVMFIATGLLVMIIPLAQTMMGTVMKSLFLLLVGITVIGMGIALPNCLSVALKDYRESAGSAGAIFGLMYYVMIGGFLAVMGIIHNGTIWPMPIYFLLLSCGLMMGSIVLARRNGLAMHEQKGIGT